MLAARGTGDQQVARLDVAMDEPLLVGRVESALAACSASAITPVVEQALLGDELGEVRAFHVAHREEEDSVGLARPEDRDDVWMVEGGGEPPDEQSAPGSARCSRTRERGT